MEVITCFYDIEFATLQSLAELCGKRHVMIQDGQLVVLFDDDEDRDAFDATPTRCKLTLYKELRRKAFSPAQGSAQD